MSNELKIPEGWSVAEKWAWTEIKEGRVADFSKYYDQQLDPKKRKGWYIKVKDRKLSSSFLVKILTDESFRSATSFKGVCINNALFKEEINLQHIVLERQLWLENCRFLGKLFFMNLHVKCWFSMEGSWFREKIFLNASEFDSHVSLSQISAASELNFGSARIGGGLYMEDVTIAKDASIASSIIGGSLHLIGSEFKMDLNMNSIEVERSVFMRKKAHFKTVVLVAARIDGSVDMNNSTFEGKLNMNSINVGTNLFMNKKATFKEVELVAAKIEGFVDLSTSAFEEKLNMNSIKVGNSLYMRNKGTYKEVTLVEAKIDGGIEMSNSTFDKMLNMNSIDVGSDLLMNNQSTFNEVKLVAAKIEDTLNLSHSTFNDNLVMDSIEVGLNLIMQHSVVSKDHEIKLYFAKIGSYFDLSAATLCEIDLTATTINGELRLGSAKGHERTNWLENSKMVLRNVTLGAIQDADSTLASWPGNLELEGFAYNNLGGFGAEGTADMLDRSSKWFLDWLDLDKTFTPQPYEQLAKILHESGYPSKSNSIRFEARKRMRSAAYDRSGDKKLECIRWFGLSLLQATIGYGIGVRYFRVLYWFGGLTLIGFLILIATIDKTNWDIFTMAWASFDQALPIIKFNEAHQKLILCSSKNWVIAFFYVQKMFGFILGGFLGAGLAGLTQRN